jgi:hypothetical protein
MILSFQYISERLRRSAKGPRQIIFPRVYMPEPEKSAGERRGPLFLAAPHIDGSSPRELERPGHILAPRQYMPERPNHMMGTILYMDGRARSRGRDPLHIRLKGI